MKARPILMGARSVQNILAGRKTQTRRIVKPQPPGWVERHRLGSFEGDHPSGKCGFAKCRCVASGPSVWTPRCPYGVPGDLLWVREKFCRAADLENDLARQWWGCDKHRHCAYAADDDVAAMEEFHPPWTSSMRMPRSLSRLTLRVIDVGVERVQSINRDDAIAEGAEPDDSGDARSEAAFDINEFAEIWNMIHGRGAWGRNDWVWKITFELLRCNVDAVARRTPGEQPTA